jgi:hypothetical protein
MFFISGASTNPSVTICLEIYTTAIRIPRVHRRGKINHDADSRPPGERQAAGLMSAG